MIAAHAGHWLVNLAYAAPVVALLGWMAVVKVRERRERRHPADDDAPA